MMPDLHILEKDLSDATVLIVDDTASLRRTIRRHLSSQGIEVLEAEDGASALSLLETKQPDLILLDLMMPGMNGFEVCKAIKQNSKVSDIPVLFLTASNTADTTLKSFEAGAVDFIGKPFEPMILLARIKTHIKLYWAMYQLRMIAQIDGLTELYNHNSICSQLELRAAEVQRHETPLSVVMFDLDHFKNINDQYGHQVGDEVLEKISKVFKESIREIDIPGRYGGEEFLLILPHTDLAAGKVIAERIRIAIEQIQWPYPNLHVTISGGIACMEKGEGSLKLIERADSLLYGAKEKGRNQIQN